MQGLVLKGAGNAQTAHLAFDQAAERVDKQLRRYMRRLKDRHGRALAAEAARVPGELLDGAAYTIFESGNEEEEAPETPLIVAETRVDIRSEEHTSELQSLMRSSYAVLCLKKKK